MCIDNGFYGCFFGCMDANRSHGRDWRSRFCQFYRDLCRFMAGFGPDAVSFLASIQNSNLKQYIACRILNVFAHFTQEKRVLSVTGSQFLVVYVRCTFLCLLALFQCRLRGDE